MGLNDFEPYREQQALIGIVYEEYDELPSYQIFQKSKRRIGPFESIDDLKKVINRKISEIIWLTKEQIEKLDAFFPNSLVRTLNDEEKKQLTPTETFPKHISDKVC